MLKFIQQQFKQQLLKFIVEFFLLVEFVIVSVQFVLKLLVQRHRAGNLTT